MPAIAAHAHVSRLDRSAAEAHTAIDAGALAELDARGFAVLPGLLSVEACRTVASLFDDDARFRSTIVMARHGFGRGTYRYFAEPLPAAVATLRSALYAALAPSADGWAEGLGRSARYPSTLEQWLARCHAAGQTRPTPLLLRYGQGDHNCLHQDLYGAEVFPFQVAVLLDAPGVDFTGGEFVLTEQRARRQSRVEVVPLRQGDAVAFAVNERAAAGARGPVRVRMRHGVGTVRSGRRHVLGLVFHDAA